MVNRDDLPLLYACVEHRAWMAAVEKHFKGERDAPLPLLDHHQCRVGVWLDAEGLNGQRHAIRLSAIAALHVRVHALADELLELHAERRGTQALDRLSELHVLRDALLELLKELIRERRAMNVQPVDGTASPAHSS